MPTLSASDYTNFIKLQAASQSYRNGAIPKKVQTSDQVVPLQSILNAQLLASQASYVAASPGTVKTRLPNITEASTTTVTDAQTNILSGAVADGTKITYTSSVPHGLVAGTTITVTGFSVLTAANVTSTAVTTIVSPTSFTITNAASAATATGTGSITGYVYYTTSVPHGLTAGQTGVSITGITTFTASSLTVQNVASSTTFALSSPTTGSAVTGQTGSITGYVYYTTETAHNLVANRLNSTYSIIGLTTTTAYNLTGFTIPLVTDSTRFRVTNSATGTAITGQSGFFEQTTTLVSRTIISANARVVPFNGRGYVNQPKNLSTVGQSGTLSSGKTQQLGGLPTTAAKWDGVYSPVPHLARVDTKATGAYRAVRQPV